MAIHGHRIAKPLQPLYEAMTWLIPAMPEPAQCFRLHTQRD